MNRGGNGAKRNAVAQARAGLWLDKNRRHELRGSRKRVWLIGRDDCRFAGTPWLGRQSELHVTWREGQRNLNGVVSVKFGRRFSTLSRGFRLATGEFDRSRSAS